MRWGIQGFLNDVDSEDSGWYKFSVLPRSTSRRNKKSKYDFGHSVTFQIADCSQKIYLDMDWNGLYFSHLSEDNLHQVDLPTIDSALKKLKQRRKKIAKFVDAVNRAGEKIAEMLDSDYDAVLEFREKVVQSKKAKERE